MNKPKPAIILVDDHVVVRNGLAELIDAMGDYSVIAQYSNGQQLLDALALSDKNKPALILMDITMPVMDGEQTVMRLKELDCDVPVLILSLNTDEQTILRLYRNGVRGYLSKDCTADGLREAIDSVLSRGFHQSDVLYKAIMAGDPLPDANAQFRQGVLNKLTSREQDFIRLVCDEAEYTYEQIASLMYVSKRTVDGYRESVFEKCNVKSKTGLVLFAIRHDLVATGNI